MALDNWLVSITLNLSEIIQGVWIRLWRGAYEEIGGETGEGTCWRVSHYPEPHMAVVN